VPTATITSKGQITIPIEVRKKLGLKAGDQINFFEDEDGKYTFEPKTRSIMEMEGILKHLGLPILGYAPSIEEMDQAILDRAAALDRASMSQANDNSEDDKVA
jgi:AbrB family looped-hinge helix DNA binding protein